MKDLLNGADRKAIARASKPAVITVLFDYESAQDIIERFHDDLRWGRFIINNRNGLNYINNIPFKDNNLDARYQITYGRVADIDVIDVAEDLRRTNKMLTSLDKILNSEYPQQIVFHTKDSLAYIKKMSYRNV